jgi:predicted pyridoxine 5'-phosphate oxidase superfamily flavin-nucleotide-binding protein
MSRLFNDSHRTLQRRFDTERLADRIEERLCRDHITADDKQFIERLDMFFLATVDAAGRPSCSYKGGDPGFVRVLDEHSIAFPNFDGNGMYLSAGNVAATGHVGILFIDFLSPKRLRLNGTARIEPASYVSPPYREAQFVIVVAVREIFPNCPRYIHKYELAERSKFVPREGAETPVPAWKQMEWARDVLPAGDPANNAGLGTPGK